MYKEFERKLDSLSTALLRTHGNTTQSFRQAIIDYALQATKGNMAFDSALPKYLQQLIDKVVFAPYSLEDEDFSSLDIKKYSDDAVLETIYCAALGAGLSRLEMFDSIMKKTFGDET